MRFYSWILYFTQASESLRNIKLHIIERAMEQQQQQQTTTVIVAAGAVQHGGSSTQAAPQNVRPFSSGLFGCFEDCGGCLYAHFMFPCYLCTLAGKLNESCCVPLFLQGGLMAMRTKVRTMWGIQVGGLGGFRVRGKLNTIFKCVCYVILDLKSCFATNSDP